MSVKDNQREIEEEIGAQSPLAEFHCIGCGKLLLKEAMLIGKIEVKCTCGVINTIEKTVITTKIDVDRNSQKKKGVKINV